MRDARKHEIHLFSGQKKKSCLLSCCVNSEIYLEKIRRTCTPRRDFVPTDEKSFPFLLLLFSLCFLPSSHFPLGTAKGSLPRETRLQDPFPEVEEKEEEENLRARCELASMSSRSTRFPRDLAVEKKEESLRKIVAALSDLLLLKRGSFSEMGSLLFPVSKNSGLGRDGERKKKHFFPLFIPRVKRVVAFATLYYAPVTPVFGSPTVSRFSRHLNANSP